MLAALCVRNMLPKTAMANAYKPKCILTLAMVPILIVTSKNGHDKDVQHGPFAEK